MRGLLALSIFAGLSGVLFAADPAAPVVAKVRRTVMHVPAHGPETSLKVTEGVYYRSATGLTYQYLGEVRGLPPMEIGRLSDHVAGKSFDVQLSRQRAVLRHRFCPNWPPRSPGRAAILGEETVNGIECVILPVRCNGLDCGRSWKSKDYHFVVRTESAIPLPGGARRNIVLEYYNIEIGKEPPAGAINFLDRFEVMDNIIPPPECPN